MRAYINDRELSIIEMIRHENGFRDVISDIFNKQEISTRQTDVDKTLQIIIQNNPQCVERGISLEKL